MKKLFIYILLFFSVSVITSCSLGTKGGKLYITDQTHSGTEILTVKILEHTYNQNSEKNIFTDYDEIISYDGYDWYVYNIPSGSWDIYIEYNEDGNYRNEREEVFIQGDSSGNEWAAIWLVDNYDFSIWTEHGGGNLNITSSLF